MNCLFNLLTTRLFVRFRPIEQTHSFERFDDTEIYSYLLKLSSPQSSWKLDNFSLPRGIDCADVR